MPFVQPQVPLTRYLQADGQPLGELPACAENTEQLRVLYRQMLLTRLFDQKAVALQRTGRIGTYAPTLGQEAIGVVLGSLMHAEDVLVPYYRDTAVQLLRGVRMEEILLYWGGDERGSAYADPAVAEDFPPCVPIATQALHACGVASAFRIRGQARVAVTTCGDGATSKGDFLEALNVAGAWQLPVVFVVNNNQWAISVPRHLQCAAATLAQKALGAGIPGEQVDGNDVLALHECLGRALQRARQGKGPSLVGVPQLPAWRSHHCRRCQPLPRQCAGAPGLGGRAAAPPAAFSGRAGGLGRGARTGLRGRLPGAYRSGGGMFRSHHRAQPGKSLRTRLCALAGGSGRAARCLARAHGAASRRRAWR